ncbi:hypothetical protein O181_041478 [Austropuccinia psidii MF-1]|uniref:Integrase catalytic domain-containing protein n=1 Tax=Austropuccinia psidii MF-1 TaxID=1389203 RepID=A0A9Q3DJ86_9BASI|nr:hypothetical protein [Austropuccinia psidii MF-1]
MEIGEDAVAAILIMSIGQESSLTFFLKTFYYAKAFNLEQISNILLVKDSHRSKKMTDSALYLSQSKELYQPTHLNHSSTCHSTKSPSNSRCFSRTSPSGATPTRFNQGSNLEEKVKAFIDKYMKEYLSNTHSENQAKEDNPERKVTEELTEDDKSFYLQEDIHDQMQLMSLSSENNIKLINDSGASQTTVCNFPPLTNPHPTKVIMRTLSGVAEITLMWKLNLGAYILYSLLFTSRSYQKNQSIIAKSGNQSFQTFPRKGNLYVSKYHHSLNLTYEEHPIYVKRDWHVILGHPSNEYLKQFLHHNCLKQSIPLNCSMCKSCKIKATPHNHPIPSAKLPVQKLHFYILENKIQRCPTYLHTDRGGEFYSANFQSEAEALGMVCKPGPANSPQTNGFSKQFKQTLLTKFWCLLAQSDVPIIFWD